MKLKPTPAAAFSIIVMILFAVSPHIHVDAQCNASTGATSGSSFSNNATTGTISWTNPQNAQTNNGVYATASGTVSLSAAMTNYLAATGFGFTIPAGSTICGVTVSVIRQRQDASVLGSITDNSVKLITGGSIGGTDHAGNTGWSTTATTVTYGGSSDLWGLTLTPTIVNAANFGAGFSAALTGTLSPLLLTAGVDYISINITYTPGVLPINLESFSAIRQNNTSVLNWTASCSTDGNQFVVQRCGNSRTWQDLASIPAAAMDRQYSYTDNHPPGGTNFYRLFLENQDGSGVYSPIQVIGQQETAVRCYPNPFTDAINICGPAPIHAVALKDLQGRTLLSKALETTTNTTQLPAGGLPPGFYLVQVDGAVFKVTKQ